MSSPTGVTVNAAGIHTIDLAIQAEWIVSHCASQGVTVTTGDVIAIIEEMEAYLESSESMEVDRDIFTRWFIENHPSYTPTIVGVVYDAETEHLIHTGIAS